MKKLKITSLIALLFLGVGVSGLMAQSQTTTPPPQKVEVRSDVVKNPTTTDPPPIVSIEDAIPAVKFQMYPNPNNGRFTVKMDPGFKGCTLYISNILGQIVYSKKVNVGEEKLEIELTNVPRGIYLLNTGSSTVKFKII